MNIIRFKKLGSHLMLIILSICYLVVLFPSQVCEASRKQINIAGLWKSNINLEYKIFQNNTNFTWDVIGRNQKANGKINGLKVSASWQGQKGMASASGTIRLDSLGRAIEIEWSNGTVFERDLPPERGLQGGKSAIEAKAQLPDNTVSAEVPALVSDVSAASCDRLHVHINKDAVFRGHTGNYRVLLTDSKPNGKVFVLEAASLWLYVPIGGKVKEASLSISYNKGSTTPSLFLMLPIIEQGKKEYYTYYASTVAARAVLPSERYLFFRIQTESPKSDWFDGDIGYKIAVHGYYTDTTCPQP